MQCLRFEMNSAIHYNLKLLLLVTDCVNGKVSMIMGKNAHYFKLTGFTQHFVNFHLACQFVTILVT